MTDTTITINETLAQGTVKMLRAAAEANSVEIPKDAKTKAQIVEHLANVSAVSDIVDHVTTAVEAKNAPVEGDEPEAEVEEERTPWAEVFLPTLTREQIAAVKENAVEVDGKSARRNRDALSAMNLSRLENDQADEAIHRIPKRIRLMFEKAMGDDSPLAEVPVSESTGSWVFNTDDSEWLRTKGQQILDLRDALDESDETQAREPVQQAVLYGSRLVVHADVLEARRERLAVSKAQPELAGTPDHEDEEGDDN